MEVQQTSGSGGSSGAFLAGARSVQDAFTQLLVAELGNQNPLEPVSNTDFINQLASFGTFEEISNLNAVLLGTAAVDQLLSAGALVGRTIDYVDESGEQQSGVARSVGLQDGAVVLDVDGHRVPLGRIREIGEVPANGNG